MARRIKSESDVSWYLPGSKKPFAGSTIAESDTIAVLLEEFGDLRVILSLGRLLSPQEKLIMQTYINHGIYKPEVR